MKIQIMHMNSFIFVILVLSFWNNTIFNTSIEFFFSKSAFVCQDGVLFDCSVGKAAGLSSDECLIVFVFSGFFFSCVCKFLYNCFYLFSYSVTFKK